ncbi:MAG: YfcE family phosphodiesterase, partial [Planctomycetota bacterium]|nr:YfcE family phosphodiesterase [Planctomycetota bacterium]
MAEQLGALLVQEEKINEETAILSLKGYIQNRETPLLRSYVDSLQRRLKNLLLDMREVIYISSAGMGLLVILSKEWKQKTGGKLVIFGLIEKNRIILETLGVTPLLKLVTTKEQALEMVEEAKHSEESFLIGVLSDTHGNTKLLKAVCNELASNFKVNSIVHLGDDCSDTSVIQDYPVEVFSVPGLYSEHYKSSEKPNRLLLDLLKWRILLSHTPTRHKNDREDDINPTKMIEEKKIDILLYGHTHVPNIEVKGNILLMNPGNLKENDKSHPPTYGLLK